LQKVAFLFTEKASSEEALPVAAPADLLAAASAPPMTSAAQQAMSADAWFDMVTSNSYLAEEQRRMRAVADPTSESEQARYN